MDDLQFRRRIYADPNTRDEDMLAAIHSDPAKQNFTQELESLDNKLFQALNIEVPSGLSDKLILRQTMASHQQQKRKSRVRLALAASIAFAMGLTINFMQFSSAYSNLGDYAIAHIVHEEGHFSNTSPVNVSLDSLNEKMATFQGSFTADIGKLMFADYCRFDGMKSLHLVFQGATSMVTVFVVPHNEDLEFTANFTNDKLIGKSQHFKHSNIIVVADKNESLVQWQTAINKNISWST
ncbi:DUF3379 family protein [Colwellia hornerae]|uniref:DUF3379 domain-containing protein n=1 Tax=Colwellia hornerae TaxID=89402 RepID=A0A5C6QNF6_9GAMM|nr:DUF3379 family protein [Colwellia hornerae]TWX56332.1 DUF3379 domain-containing protein [Colwellia hornerae]TWX62183.1 DUF3379 domain-containing protein [Colwellia hornerae]TWX70585.1 DUF3379 domain-containing protein [Colwellia hornerae]